MLNFDCFSFSVVQMQIAKYKADILKLQASEAEIRTLSVNYAAILKEKEGDRISLYFQFRMERMKEVKQGGRRTGGGGQSSTRLCTVRYVPVWQLTDTWTGCYRAILLQSVVDDRCRPSAVEIDHQRSIEEEKGKKKKRKRRKKKRRRSTSCRPRLRVAHGRLWSPRWERDRGDIEKDELDQNLKLHMQSTSEKAVDSTEISLQAPGMQQQYVLRFSAFLHGLMISFSVLFVSLPAASKSSVNIRTHMFIWKLFQELEDSDKMDEDSKMIEDLRANCDQQRAQVLQLEKALRQEIAKTEELKKLKNDELRNSNETISDLKQKLANCMSIVNSKNVELLNLQTALGQYYAESEAKVSVCTSILLTCGSYCQKERLGRDLARAREEAAKLSESLKV
ncbi:hypothetical protein BHE74_00030625 [Ensete ventricosum]|nr:hypothetical protein GW17_00003322 [Ensete ventricosum]RWW62249.1 hypothetical protein BHE74_00030625 [Ensete ventricosum]